MDMKSWPGRPPNITQAQYERLREIVNLRRELLREMIAICEAVGITKQFAQRQVTVGIKRYDALRKED